MVVLYKQTCAEVDLSEILPDNGKFICNPTPT